MAQPSTSADPLPLLFGSDDTPGIVSVMADRSGRARVWRRVGAHVVAEEHTYPNWFFLARRELLGDLPVVELPGSILETKPELEPGAIGLVPLKGDSPFRYLVLTHRLDDVERYITEKTRRAHEAGEFREPLSELMYVRPPVEQYLAITGRTYFKGMTYRDIRRLQFDLETTSLDSGTGKIFMVALRDSDGFSAVLDIGSMSEAELLQELVRIVQERDPDVLENHNIFEFDIRFLMKRAQTLEVPLPLGRDGSTFSESRDTVKIGATNESFTRYSVAGREIVDTLHATRRYSAIQRDLRSNSLKEAARYFGVAKPDRVYLEGTEIWPTFQQDPDRVRRYCLDDVEEVDRLSPVLLASSFALASMVPRAYERIATAGTGQGLIEPLLVRAYVMRGQSLPLGRASGSFPGALTGLFTTGVVHNVVKADVASLYPSIMLAERIGPASDQCGAFLALLEELTRRRLDHKGEARRADLPAAERSYHDSMQSAVKVLINSFYGTLGASFALFCDKAAAERVAARGRQILQQVLDGLRHSGAVLVEADTDGVLFSLPTREDGRPWTYEDEVALIEDVASALPAGVHLEHDGRYQAMYSYLEKNYALLDYPESRPGLPQREVPLSLTLPHQGGGNEVRLVGVAFKSTKTEPIIEQFLREALRLILRGDYAGVRDLYRSACADLRTGRIPTADLCVTMPLTKDPKKYAQAKRKEEPYEVWLAAGHTGWRTGMRIRYYQARNGSKKLLVPDATDYDPDFYIGRLRHTCMQRLERAFAPEDLETLFRESDGLFDKPVGEIQPLFVAHEAPLAGVLP